MFIALVLEIRLGNPKAAAHVAVRPLIQCWSVVTVSVNNKYFRFKEENPSLLEED